MPEKNMSTFIYQNGVLHADTRKIVNFPGRHMLTTDSESKVHKDKWCYIAVSGFEASPKVINHIKTAITVIQCCREVSAVVQEVMKNAARKRGRADFLADIAMLEKRYIDSQDAILGDVAFLAVTRDFIFGCEGELAESAYYRGIKAQASDSIEVIGSAQHAARILLLNGVAPKDIYPVLRRGNAPTGESCESFDTKKLAPLSAPWLNEEVWFQALAGVRNKATLVDKQKLISEDDKDAMTDLYMLVPLMGKFRWNRNYPDAASIEKTINGWLDKKHRGSDKYKTYRKGFFK